MEVTAWKKKRSRFVVGSDSCGNDYLLAETGAVSFLDHETGQEKVLAQGLPEFLGNLGPATPVVLKPGQVKHAWIDPSFLEEQQRKEMPDQSPEPTRSARGSS